MSNHIDIVKEFQELAFRLNNHLNRNFIITQCYERLNNYESIKYFTNRYENEHIGFGELNSCSSEDIGFLKNLLNHNQQ